MFRVRNAPESGAAAGAKRGRLGVRWLPVTLCLLLACWPTRPARAWAGTTPPPENEESAEAPLAVLVSEPSLACAWQGREGEPPLPVVVPLEGGALAEPGRLDEALACARERRLEIVPRLHPPTAWQSEQDPYGAVAPWLDDLAAFLERHAGRLRRIELSPGRPGDFDPPAWAYLVEKCGSLLRSYRPPFRLIAGPYGASDQDWLERIPHDRLRPYLDALSVSEGASPGAARSSLAAAYTGVPVWIHLESQGDPSALLARLHAGRVSGATTVVLPGSLTHEERDAAAAFIRLVPSRYVPDPAPPGVRIEGSTERASAGDWADTLGPERVALLDASAAQDVVRLRFGGGALRQVRAFDLADGRELAGRVEAGAEGEPPLVLIEPPRSLLLVRFVPEGDPRAEPETVGVTAEIELTAPEIIARLRAVEEAQRRATLHYTATATLSYHYRAEAYSIAIDVTSVNRFFWKDGVGEYEETGLLINGARWRGPVPNLPFVQADKVREVPIEVRLDEAYTYRLAGRDRVRGRTAYVLAFDPLSSGESRYSGRVWIDAETFERLRIRLVQEGLEPPITSSEDVIEFGRAPGAGPEHWVPLEGYRQMVFTVLGRSMAVERTVVYEDFAVNGENFEEVRKLAWASGRRMSRDDSAGFASMMKRPGGGLSWESESLKNVAVWGGFTLGTDPVASSPVAVINYFDFDWRGTGTQLDMAWAGPAVFGSWTDPSLAGTKWELSAEGLLLGIEEKLKRTTDDGRSGEEDLDLLRESALGTIARPLTTHSKGEFQLQAVHEWFSPLGEEVEPGMVLPPDVLTTTALGRWAYNRSGFELKAWGSVSKRSGWDDWGYFPPDPDPNDPNVLAPPPGAHGSREDDRYHRWGLSVSKALYPLGFQKLGMGLSYNAGSGLDRFSRFRIGEFGSIRVRGFNGRDYSFDRGLSGRFEWLTPIPRTGLSLEVNLDGAILENREDFLALEGDQGVRNPDYREHIVGGGLGVSFNGPWGSLISISGARVIDSSMDVSAGSPSVSIKMIKTFGDWPWKRRPMDAGVRTADDAEDGEVAEVDPNSQRENR